MTKFISICVFVLSFSLVVKAADSMEGSKPGPCSKDAETLCAGVIGSHAATVKCLRENEAKLSKECTAHLVEMKQAMKEVAEACHEDFENLCAGVQKGGGRVMKCMKEHNDQLSAACKEAIEKKKEVRKKK
jgi:cysteine rich repeat protein